MTDKKLQEIARKDTQRAISTTKEMYSIFETFFKAEPLIKPDTKKKGGK